MIIMIPTLFTILLSAASAAATTQFAGVNIPGFDFTISTLGEMVWEQNLTPNGDGQMAHFVNDDGLNLFRLPVPWQWLMTTPADELNADHWSTYDDLVQECLDTGAHCIIDLHNYARWENTIIGQGGPTNDQFASVWSQIATKYVDEDNIIFGLMNEPHDLVVDEWVTTCQAAVTAIRNAGATSQIILLPGSTYSNVGSFPYESAPYLATITNVDNTTDNLVFDLHQYFDGNGGTTTECVDAYIDTFETLTTYLESNGRQAMLTEFGGGNTASCLSIVCEVTAYLNENSDQWLGYSIWAAGGFTSSYALYETPTYSDGVWTDQELLAQCVAR